MDGRNFSNENDTLEYGGDGYDYYQYFMDVIKPQLSDRDFLPPALPISVKVILAICYLIIIVISIVGNVMVICIICRYHKMRTVTNTFLGSLAVSGLLFIYEMYRMCDMSRLTVTARIRSLREGNVFRSVCTSVHFQPLIS